MARHSPVIGPRGLACPLALKRADAVTNRATKEVGRCGQCRSCWRLFVFMMRSLGRKLPKATRNGYIAGFGFTKFRREVPQE